MQQLNRELRHELQRAMALAKKTMEQGGDAPAEASRNSNEQMLQHRVEMLASHNRVRERVFTV